MNALKSLALLLLFAALLAGCKPAEKPAAQGTELNLETSWPKEGISLKYTLLVADETLQIPPDVLQQREKDLISLHTHDALFKAVEAASAVSDIGQKINLYETEVVAVELAASFAGEIVDSPEKDRLIPSSGDRVVQGEVRRRFIMRPVTLTVRDEVTGDERAKLEKALGEMKVYALRQGTSNFLGYFAAKSEKEAIEDAVKVVIANAHVRMQFARKAAQPTE